MAYTKAHYDLASAAGSESLSQVLKLNNMGISVHVFGPGEGFDFFHNHREQEEIYFCLDGTADLRIAGENSTTVHLKMGDIVRVSPGTLRAIGNDGSEKGVVFIAGACPHTYPAGIDHHDVIADVMRVTGKGKTGFQMPQGISGTVQTGEDPDC